FVPPHPGPVAAPGLLGANVGLVLVCGLIIAIPAWYLTGYLFGLFIGKRIEVSVPDVLSGGKSDEFAEFASRPKLSQVVFLLVLPLVLIFANTGLNFAGEAGWVDPESIPVASLRLLGETPIALLITVVIAMWLLGWRQQKGRAMVENVVASPWDRSARSSSSPGPAACSEAFCAPAASAIRLLPWVCRSSSPGSSSPPSCASPRVLRPWR